MQMIHSTKRILAMLLTVAMLLSLLPVSAFAEGEAPAETAYSEETAGEVPPAQESNNEGETSAETPEPPAAPEDTDESETPEQPEEPEDPTDPDEGDTTPEEPTDNSEGDAAPEGEGETVPDEDGEEPEEDGENKNDMVSALTDNNAVAINETSFPDAAFRTYVGGFDTDNDGSLSAGEIAAVTAIDVHEMGIESLEGIGYFTALTSLNCANNHITSLDLSGNPLVTENNLNCSGNVLDIALYNGVFLLDSLPGFDLTKADWPEEYCMVVGRALEPLVNMVTYEYDLGNNLTASFTLNITEVDLEEALDIDEDYFPDAIFRQFISDNYDVDHDDLLSSAERANVSQMNVANLGIKDLRGIEFFKYVMRLDCSGNCLTSLDLSRNSWQINVVCENNCLDILLRSGKYDLALLPGFDKSKTSNWKNARFVNSTTVLTPMNVDEPVTYSYECRSGVTVNFKLRPAGSCVGISAETFPDPFLRAYVAKYIDTDGDGALSDAEAAAVTVLDINADVINTITQDDLLIYANAIVENENGYYPTIVNLAGIETFKNLTELNCRDNTINRLDLSKNTALEVLDCSANAIEFINLSALTRLRKLNCSYNLLTELDVSNNTELVELRCNTFSYYSSLEMGPPISPSAERTLTLGSISKLEILDCSHNYIKALDLSHLTALRELNCDECGLSALNVSANTELTSLSCSANAFGSLDLTNNTKLVTVVCRNSSNYVTNTPKLVNLLLGNNSALVKLDCSRNNISSLNLQGCTALEELNCSDNNLNRPLDASNCTALTTLNCSGNLRMTGLNVSGCTSLVSLRCDRTGITALNLTGLSMLKELECCDNSGMTSLVLTGCSALSALNCSDCELSALDLSSCTALTNLDCSQNNIANLDVSANTSLKVLVCEARIMPSVLPGEENIPRESGVTKSLRTLVLGANTNLTELYCTGNTLLTQLDVSGCTNLSQLSCSNCGFSTLNLGANTGLTALSCDNNNLSSLNLSGCTGLSWLSCISCGVTSLDLSANTALTELDCSENALTQLNVNGCTELSQLNCSNCGLPALDLSTNTGLNNLVCSGNSLSTLGLNACTALGTVVCSNNNISALDLSANTALTAVVCDNNNISSLDLSANTELYSLICDNNNISTLDLSGNLGLYLLSCSDNPLYAIKLYDRTDIFELNADLAPAEIELTNSCFDLSTLEGFDIEKASNWKNAVIVGNILYPTGNPITYDYFSGLMVIDPNKPHVPGINVNFNCSFVTDITDIKGIDILNDGVRVNGTIVPVDPSLSSTLSLTASQLPANSSSLFTWTSSNPSVATVSNSGVVTCLKAGTTVIKVTSGVNPSVYASCTVKVTTWISSIELSGMETLASGRSALIRADILPTIAENKILSWTSSDVDVATVSASGLVTAKPVTERTEVTITAAAIDGSGVTGTHTMYIYPAVTGIQLHRVDNGHEDDLGNKVVYIDPAIDGSISLRCTVLPDAAKKDVTWKSSSGLVTVAEEENVTNVTFDPSIAPNTSVTVSARATDGTDKNTSIYFKTVKSVSEVSIPETKSLAGGKSVTLTPTITPADATIKTVIWTVDKPEVATVNENGIVTAKAVSSRDTVVVTCTPRDGYGQPASCTISVYPAATGVEIYTGEGEDREVVNGKTKYLDLSKTHTISFGADVVPAEAMQDVTWTSSSSQFVIAEDGTITANQNIAVNVGTTITATAKDGTGRYASFLLKTGKGVQEINLEGYSALAGGKSTVIKSTVLPADATVKTLKWSIPEEYKAYATVNASGLVTASAVTERHSIVVLCEATDDSGVKAEFSMTIYPAATGVEIYTGEGESREKINGRTRYLDLNKTHTIKLETAVVPGEAMQSVTWKSSNTRFKISEDGLVTADENIAQGVSTTITATAADGTGKYASFTLKTVRGVQEIKLDGSATLTGGKSTTVKAAILPADATVKTLKWSIPEEYKDYASVSTTGVVTAKAVTERQNIVVVCEATDDSGVRAEHRILIYPAATGVKIFDKDGINELGGKQIELDLSKELTVKFTASVVPEAANQGIQWKSSNSLATVDETGLVTVSQSIGTGTIITITATAADGTGKYTTVKIKAIRSVMELLMDKTAVVASDRTITLKPVITPSNASNKTLIWTSSDDSVATVTSAGVVKGMKVDKPKTATITATAADNSGVHAECVVTVYAASTGIEIHKGGTNVSGKIVDVDLSHEEQVSLEGVVNPLGGAYDMVEWSSNNSLAPVDKDGLVTFASNIGTGTTVTITAKTMDGLARTTNVRLKVVRSVTDIELQKEAVIGSGRSVTLKPVIAPSNATNKSVKWSIVDGNAAAATVSSSGVVTGKTVENKETITVRCDAADNSGIYAECRVDVYPAVTAVQIFKDGEVTNGKTRYIDLSDGRSMTLTAGTQPVNAYQKVLWKSSNSHVKVTDGVVEFDETVKVGTTVTITATAQDGTGKAASVTIKTVNSVRGIELQETADVGSGRTVTLKPTVLPTGASVKSLTWKSFDENVATVSSSGVVTGKPVEKKTDVVIRCTATDDSSVYAECTVSVYPAATGVKILNDEGEAISGTITVDLTNELTRQLGSEVLSAQACQKVTWKSSNANVGVNENGLVTFYDSTPTGASITITATAADNSGRSASIVFKTIRSVKSITMPNTASLASGKSMTFAPVILPMNAGNRGLKWSLAYTTAATISSSGVLTAKQVTEPTEVLVICNAADGRGAVASCTVTIYPASADVQILRDGKAVQGTTEYVDLTKATEVNLSGVVYPEGSGQGLKWRSSSDFAAVDDNGRVTFDVNTPAGTVVTISAATTDGLAKYASVNIKAVRSAVEINVPESIQIVLGETKQIDWSAEPEGSSVVWSVAEGGEEYVFVDPTGRITAKKVTETPVTLTCASADGSVSESLEVNVYPKTESIRISVDGQELKNGDRISVDIADSNSVSFSAVVLPENAMQDIQWSFTDTGCVSSIEDGVIHLTNENSGYGKYAVVNLHAETSDGSKCADVAIDVTQHVAGISLPNTVLYSGAELRAGVVPNGARYGSVVWTSSDTSAAIVNDDGWVTAMPVSEPTSVTISCADADYPAYTASCEVTVYPAIEDVSVYRVIDTEEIGLKNGQVIELDLSHEDSIRFRTEAYPATPEQAYYNANKLIDGNPVKVECQDGLIEFDEATETGTTVFVTTGYAGCRAMEKSFTVRIIRTAKGITLPATADVAVGKTLTLKPEFTPENVSSEAVTWTSSNESVATVNAKGVVTGKTVKEPTEVTITAAAQDGSAMSAECTVTVHPAATSVQITRDIDDDTVVVNGKTQELDLSRDEPIALGFKVLPEGAYQKVTWKSNNKLASVVEEDGVYYVRVEDSIGTGTSVTITATSADGTGRSASVPIKIKRTVTALSLPEAEGVAAGKSITLKPDIQPANPTSKSVKWESSDTSVATVNTSGVVTGKAVAVKQTVTITATAADGSGRQASCLVTVYPAATGVQITREIDGETETVSGKTITVDLSKTGTADTEPMVFSATVLPLDAYEGVMWRSNNKSALVENGVVTFDRSISTGTTVAISALATDGTGKSATVNIKVIRTVNNITLQESANLASGRTLTLKPVLEPANVSNKTLKWSSSNEAVATVNSSGVVTGKLVTAATPVTISCTAADENVVTKTCEITVYPATTGIELFKVQNNEELPLKNGEQLDVDLSMVDGIQLSAKAAPYDRAMQGMALQDVVWKSSSNQALVTEEGFVGFRGTITNGTVVTITATATDGTGKSANVRLRVIRSITALELDDVPALASGKSVTLKPVMTPSKPSNTSFIWASSDTSAATVSTSGTVTAKAVTAPTNVTITCTAKDDYKVFASCRVTVYPAASSVQITQGADAIVVNGKTLNLDLTKENQIKLGANVLPQGVRNEVTWKTNNKLAVVDENGLVTFDQGIGTSVNVVVTATAADGSGRSASVTVKTIRTVREIQAAAFANVAAGRSATLAYSIVPANAGNRKLVWLSSDTSVATVNTSGVVTGKTVSEPTEVIITATTTDGSNYVHRWHVTVYPQVTSVQIVKDDVVVNGKTKYVDLKKDPSVRISANIMPDSSYGKVEWLSNNKNAVVSDAGSYAEIIFNESMKVNTTVAVTARAKDGTGKSAVVNFKLIKSIDSLTLPESAVLGSGRTMTLKPVIAPTDATVKTLKWESSDTAVATVNGSGTVTAKTVAAPTKVTISCTATDDYSATASCEFTVYPAATTVQITRTVGETTEVINGKTQSFDLSTETERDLDFKIIPDGADQKVTWKTNNKLAFVNEDGIVTFDSSIGTGTTITVTATATDGTAKSASTSIKVIRSITDFELQESASVGSGRTVTLKTTINPANASTKTLKWESSETTIATVNASGVVTGKTVSEPTNVTITATTTDGTNISKSCRVTVYPAATTVQILQGSTVVNGKTKYIDLAKGQTIQFASKVQPDNACGTVAWKSNNSLVTVKANGLAEFGSSIKNGTTVTVTATATDGTGKSASVYVKVIKSIDSLTLPESAVLGSGRTMTLKPVIAPTDATVKTLKWESSNTAAATVNGSGTVTAKAVTAPTKVTITCTATDDYNAAASCEFTIYPAATTVQITRTIGDKTEVVNGKTLDVDMSKSDNAVQLGFAIVPESANNGVTWKSSSSQATVDESGRVQFADTVSTGTTVTITATATDGTGRSATVRLKAIRTVTSIVIPETMDLAFGKTLTLKPQVFPTNASSKAVKWSVDDPSIATVNSSGVVTPYALIEKKTVTVTATAADGSGTSASCRVTVYPAANRVLVYDKENNLVSGKSITATSAELTLRAVCIPDEACQNFTWTSSNKLVEIDNNGKVRIMPDVTRGTVVTLTAKTTDGTAKSATVKLIISTDIEWTDPIM